MNKDAEKVHLRDLDPLIEAESKKMLEGLRETMKRYEAMTPEEKAARRARRKAINERNLAILEREDPDFMQRRPEYFGSGLDREK